MPSGRQIPTRLPALVIIERTLTRVANCNRGAISLLFAIVLPLGLLMAGGAIDFLRVHRLKADLRSVADIVALSTARELAMGQAAEYDLKDVAKSYFKANANASLQTAKFEVNVDLKTKKVSVSLAIVPKNLFPLGFRFGEIKQAATAEVVGSVPLCVLALNGSKDGTIRLQLNARLTGMNCGIYSNSGGSDGIKVAAGATLAGGVVCSTGGGSGNVQPELMVDCPALDDPLAKRSAPEVSTCDETDKIVGIKSTLVAKLTASRFAQTLAIGFEVAGESKEVMETSSETPPPEERNIDRDEIVTLKPGVYCGGLRIGGLADVELLPGVYIMKDGPLHVDGSSRLAGDNVGFYLTGSKSTMFFGAQTTISLTAPKDGDLAGILFFEDRNSSEGRLFSILSDDARVLTGTVYLPKATLVIDADRPIADQSAYTAIIAREISLYAGPHLVLNSNYSQTDIPAPASAPNGGQVKLTN